MMDSRENQAETHIFAFLLNEKLPSGLRRAGKLFNCKLGFNGFDDHILEQDLERHGMSTTFVGQEKLAVAVKNTAIIINRVFIVIPMKSKFKFIEAEAMAILRVTFCFFELADQSVVHGTSLLF
jgi:hypothetical protein